MSSKQEIGALTFEAIIADLDGGALAARLSTDIQQIVRAVQDTGKDGSLTLKIKVADDGKTVSIGADVKTTIPREKVAETCYYADDRGGLHKENPRQVRLWPEAQRIPRIPSAAPAATSELPPNPASDD